MAMSDEVGEVEQPDVDITNISISSWIISAGVNHG